MSPDCYNVELDPETRTTLKMYLFTKVENVEVIRNNIITGVWNCAAIKPELILDPFQVIVAANKAVVSEKLNNMATRTVFAEILYNLSLTKNISQSLIKFGIEKNENILLCFLVSEGKDDSVDILPQITGEPCPISDICKLTNMNEVKRLYNLKSLTNDDRNFLLDVVVSKMVTKSFVSH